VKITRKIVVVYGYSSKSGPEDMSVVEKCVRKGINALKNYALLRVWVDGWINNIFLFHLEV
jgi:hypothetical protein